MMTRTDFRWFKQDLCDRCGDCFSHCRVLNLPTEAASTDIGHLMEGRHDASLAFSMCTTCNACDLVCPKQANPYELILESFDRYRNDHGLPFLAKMVFPNEPENIWSALRICMAKDELELVKKWELNLQRKQKQILLTGFYTNMVPYLTQANFLSGLQPIIAGSEGLWGCGGDSNKLGAIQITEEVVALLEHHFVKMGVEKVICFMEAEAAMLGEILPKRYGARFPFEVSTMDDWILENLKKGVIKINSPMNETVTVHDNCMSRYFGGRHQDVIREIISASGGKLVEMKHNRNNALCCGWAATIPTLHGKGSGNPTRTMLYMLTSLDRRLSEALDTGAKIMVTGCPACFIFLNLIKQVVGADIDILHPIQIVQRATGEKVDRRIDNRCWDILAIASSLLVKWGTSADSRRPFFPKGPHGLEINSLPEISKKDAARIRFLSKIFSGRTFQNRISKKALGLLSKTSIGAYRMNLERQRERQIK